MSFNRDMDKPIAERVLARYASTALDEKMKALLLKLRKGADSSLSLAQLFKVLALLGGWRVEEIIGLVPKHFMYGTEEHLEFLAEDNEALARQTYDQLKEKVVSSLPTHPAQGHEYVMGLEPFRSWDVSHGSGKRHGTKYRSWVGAQGYRFTSPDGKVFELLPTRWEVMRERKKLSVGNVLRWLKEDGTYLQQINDLLGMDPHGKAPPRTRDNTGTCAVCFRNIKLVTKGHDKTMALHGYNRPGHGEVVGRCWGGDHAPYELSSEATEIFLEEKWKPHLVHAQVYAEGLKTASSFDANYFSLALGAPSKIVTNQDPEWERKYKIHMALAENEVRYAKKSVRLYAYLIAHWELRELPKANELHVDYYATASLKVGLEPE